MRSLPWSASLAAVLCSAPLFAQSQPPPPVGMSVSRILFDSNQLPWTALHNTGFSLPWGYDQSLGPVGAWPIGVSIGDIDNDGRDDFLLQLEQRLLIAFGLNLDTAGNPTTPYVIWAYFDPKAIYFKHNGWVQEQGVIWDFDGDGANEVAAVLSGDERIDGCDLAMYPPFVAVLGPPYLPDPNFGDLPRPTIIDRVYLDDLPGSGSSPGSPTVWACQLALGELATASLTDLQVANIRGLTEPRDLLLSDTSRGRPHLFSYGDHDANPATPKKLTLLDWRGITDPANHTVHAYDVDGDGFDEVLINGVHDFDSGCDWSIAGFPLFATCSGQNNHPDEIQAIDTAGDGLPELLWVHDCYDFMTSGAPLSCSPELVPGGSFTSLPAQHGQSILIGNFIAGPDPSGYDGPEYMAMPKGVPFQHANSWGNYVANGNGVALAMSLFSVGQTAIGPRAGAMVIDWDGDRTTDEVMSEFGNRISIWRLASTTSGSFPYEWQEVAHFSPLVWSGFANSQADLFGDRRAEVVTVGRWGMEIASNNTAFTTELAALDLWQSADYRRWFAAPISRHVDYAAMPKLERVDILPLTGAGTPGSQITYTAIGRYVDGHGNVTDVDLTSKVQWTSANTSVASFSGSSLTLHTEGLTAIRATLSDLAMTNDGPALAYVSNDPRPRILYAGYADTYLTAGVASTLTFEARVADPQNDVLEVRPSVGSVQYPPALDNGLNGDKVAGDGIFTLTLPGVALAGPLELDVTAAAVDAGANSSDVWPYLTVGSATPVVPGWGLSSWASETTGPGPLPMLAGVGFGPTSLQPNTPGTITFMAHVTDPSVALISPWAAGVDWTAIANMNDLGLGADQLAGDGLWTGSITTGPNGVAAGRYGMVQLPVRAQPFAIGDAYPRLRIHQ